MGYNLLMSLIKRNKKTPAELTKLANVYVAAGQLSSDEYMEIMEIINAMA